jgi:hypothetical protein
LEDYEDGTAFEGGEGRDGSIKVSMGWAGEAERDVWVGSRVVDGVEEQADELSTIICSRKKREKRDAEEL